MFGVSTRADPSTAILVYRSLGQFLKAYKVMTF